MDDTGTISFKIWDNAELMTSIMSSGLPVLVKAGVCEEFNKQLSVKITLVEALPPEQAGEFMLKAPIPFDNLKEKWDNYVQLLKEEERIDLEPGLARLEQSGVLNTFFNIPAGRRMHHVYMHGLLQHTIEVCDMVDRTISLMVHYHNLDVDRGIALCAAMFHDIGKVAEYEISPVNTLDAFTPDGELLGHHILSADAFDKLFRKAFSEFPDRLRGVKHCILSHHGRQDWGACMEPKTLEAHLVSKADHLSCLWEVFLNTR